VQGDGCGEPRPTAKHKGPSRGEYGKKTLIPRSPKDKPLLKKTGGADLRARENNEKKPERHGALRARCGNRSTARSSDDGGRKGAIEILARDWWRKSRFSRPSSGRPEPASWKKRGQKTPQRRQNSEEGEEFDPKKKQ